MLESSNDSQSLTYVLLQYNSLPVLLKSSYSAETHPRISNALLHSVSPSHRFTHSPAALVNTCTTALAMYVQGSWSRYTVCKCIHKYTRPISKAMATTWADKVKWYLTSSRLSFSIVARLE